MRSYGSIYIGNGSAAAQALIRQARAVRRSKPALFVVGPWRDEVRSDGTTVRVRSPASARFDAGIVHRLYTRGGS